jgi:hypothetical protein
MGAAILQSWTQWQLDVLAVLRADFRDVLIRVELEDVDWATWRELYVQGRSPRAAVNRALERDL